MKSLNWYEAASGAIRGNVMFATSALVLPPLVAAGSLIVMRQLSSTLSVHHTIGGRPWPEAALQLFACAAFGMASGNALYWATLAKGDTLIVAAINVYVGISACIVSILLRAK